MQEMGDGEGRLLDWESTVGVFTTIKKPKHTTPSALKGLSGSGGGGGAETAGVAVHDVGVRGFLPRVNKTAIVSRFNPALRPASRYMHMASIAKVGDRYLRGRLAPPPAPPEHGLQSATRAHRPVPASPTSTLPRCGGAWFAACREVAIDIYDGWA